MTYFVAVPSPAELDEERKSWPAWLTVLAASHDKAKLAHLRAEKSPFASDALKAWQHSRFALTWRIFAEAWNEWDKRPFDQELQVEPLRLRWEGTS